MKIKRKMMSIAFLFLIAPFFVHSQGIESGDISCEEASKKVKFEKDLPADCFLENAEEFLNSDEEYPINPIQIDEISLVSFNVDNRIVKFEAFLSSFTDEEKEFRYSALILNSENNKKFEKTYGDKFLLFPEQRKKALTVEYKIPAEAEEGSYSLYLVVFEETTESDDLSVFVDFFTINNKGKVISENIVAKTNENLFNTALANEVNKSESIEEENGTNNAKEVMILVVALTIFFAIVYIIIKKGLFEGKMGIFIIFVFLFLGLLFANTSYAYVGGGGCSANFPGRCNTYSDTNFNASKAGYYKIKSITIGRGNNVKLYECQGREDFYYTINGTSSKMFWDPWACEMTRDDTYYYPDNNHLLYFKKGTNTLRFNHGIRSYGASSSLGKAAKKSINSVHARVNFEFVKPATTPPSTVINIPSSSPVEYWQNEEVPLSGYGILGTGGGNFDRYVWVDDTTNKNNCSTKNGTTLRYIASGDPGFSTTGDSFSVSNLLPGSHMICLNARQAYTDNTASWSSPVAYKQIIINAKEDGRCGDAWRSYGCGEGSIDLANLCYSLPAATEIINFGDDAENPLSASWTCPNAGPETNPATCNVQKAPSFESSCGIANDGSFKELNESSSELCGSGSSLINNTFKLTSDGENWEWYCIGQCSSDAPTGKRCSARFNDSSNWIEVSP